MATAIQMPFEMFVDTDGTPLNNGKIYIGTVNLNPITNPITVYWDSALTQPAAQPIRTNGGFPVRSGTAATLYVSSSYSILIRNQSDETLYSRLNVPAAQGAGSGFVAEGLQSIQITDLNFDPTLLGLAIGETRCYYTSNNPSNPWGGYTGYYALTLTKETATEFRLMGVNGTTMFARAYSSGWGSVGVIPGQYDFIVNSSAALAQWRTGGGGFTYERVYIAPGSFSADCTGASGNAAAGEGINLTLAGTKTIVGSTGSMITLTNIVASSTKGSLYYTAKPTGTDYAIKGLNMALSAANGLYQCINIDGVTLTSGVASSRDGGFYKCSNISRSSFSASSSTAGNVGFSNCDGISMCSASPDSTVTVACFLSCSGISNINAAFSAGTNTPDFKVFDSCEGISGCKLSLTGGNKAGQTCMIMSGCLSVSACRLTLSSANATGINYGISGSFYVSSCFIQVQNAASQNYAYNTVSNMVACSGSASGATTNRCFNSCNKMGFNIAGTGGYVSCFADNATNATAATAAGGYNL